MFALMLKILRIVFGMLLVAVLFIPFGVYHSLTEPYIVGHLWGFLLPVGYVAAALGIGVIVFSKSTLLRRFGLGYYLMLVGLLLLFFLLAFPSKYFINLIQGTNFSFDSIDI